MCEHRYNLSGFYERFRSSGASLRQVHASLFTRVPRMGMLSCRKVSMSRKAAPDQAHSYTSPNMQAAVDALVSATQQSVFLGLQHALQYLSTGTSLQVAACHHMQPPKLLPRIPIHAGLAKRSTAVRSCIPHALQQSGAARTFVLCQAAAVKGSSGGLHRAHGRRPEVRVPCLISKQCLGPAGSCPCLLWSKRRLLVWWVQQVLLQPTLLWDAA